jgi:HD-GYP domain-containing protein (c-di-GMP phosphodiesterase class II)
MTESARGPRRRQDEDGAAIESQIGPLLVARLHGLFRAVRIYDLANRTVQDQLREVLGLLEQIMEDEVVLVAMGQCFYVNGVRVRAEASQASYFDALTAEFEQRKLGGLRFLHGLRADELSGFLKLMVEHGDPERAAGLAEAATTAGIVHVAPLTLGEVQSHEEGAESPQAQAPATTERERARQTVRQAVSGTRAAILSTARTGKPAMRKIKRVVQPIVDSIMKNEYSMVGLTAIKNHDEYTYAHCVNVSILSVAMGHSLGLSRAALANMGVAALLHDIGKLMIPKEVLRKPDRLSAEEWGLMQRHPVEGLKTVSRVPGLSSLTVDLLNVTFQHHQTPDGKGYPRVARESHLAVMSRIVAVADCFDAMTAHREYRKRPFTGYEALRLLLGPDRARYDSGALWALVQTVGLYPAGTLLVTDSGHLLVSLSPNLDDVRRPNCLVLARPDGSMPADSHPEMWSPMPAEYRVTRVLDPDEYEGEVDRLLAA